MGSSFHGVLHEMSSSDMEKLDNFESGYTRMDCKVRLYDGEIRHATVYSIDESKIPGIPRKPPSERYLEILISGATHYGVAQSHIDYLKSLPFIPRVKPDEFRKFNVSSNLPIWTMKEVTKGDGKDGNPIYLSLNGKVLRFTGNASSFFYEGMIKRYATKNVEINFSKMIYEPKYGSYDTIEEYSREHCAYIEDNWAGFNRGNFEVVALIDQVYADGSSSLGRGSGQS